MAVTLNAKATSVATGSGVTTLTNNALTIGAISNTGLVALAAFDNGSSAPTNLAATWNAVSMGTSLGSSGTAAAGNVNIFGQVNPTTGNKSLTATWTGAADCYLDGIAFDGVNQTGGATSFAHFTANNGGPSTSPCTTGAVTSATGNQVVGVHQQDGGVWGAISGNTINTSTALAENYAGNYNSGAATVTLTAAYSSPASFVSAGVDVVAAGAGGFLAAWAIGSNLPVLGTGNF